MTDDAFPTTEDVPDAGKHKRELYCCDSLFDAVTGAAPLVRVMRTPEAGWTLDGKPVGLQFCPWCGEALPEDGFTGEFELAEIADARTEMHFVKS